MTKVSARGLDRVPYMVSGEARDRVPLRRVERARVIWILMCHDNSICARGFFRVMRHSRTIRLVPETPSALSASRLVADPERTRPSHRVVALLESHVVHVPLPRRSRWIRPIQVNFLVLRFHRGHHLGRPAIQLAE